MTRNVIITGASKGIGRAIALRLSREGFRLVLSYLNDRRSADETLNACQSINAQVMLVRSDVTNSEDVEHLVQEVHRNFGSVDVLINNAGVNIDKSLHAMTVDDWDRVVDTNMKGVFLCSQIASRRMIEQEQGGIILNIGATTGIRGRVNGINYCAAKAGVLTMTKCLALELAPKIRVNCVIPGLVETEEAAERFRLTESHHRAKCERKIPIGYIGAADDVAKAVSYLLSDNASYINGQKIIVDGGQYMY